MSIFKKADSHLLKGVLALSYLRDELDVELKKLKAMEGMISYTGIDNGVIFQNKNVSEGIAYILKDIGLSIEGNLDKVDSIVEAKVREAVAQTKCTDPSLHTDFVRRPFYKDEEANKENKLTKAN